MELIREAGFQTTMERVVEPGLAALREEIDMPLAEGGAMHVEVYAPQGAKRAVVILHGQRHALEDLVYAEGFGQLVGL